MARRTLVLGLAVLLIVSTLMVLGTGASRGAAAPLSGPSVAPTSAAAHPSVTSIELATYEANDIYDNTTYFATGGWNYGGSNVLFFTVYDPTADSMVNFTISDPNATRDHVGSPAFTESVATNATTHLYSSYLYGISYTFPSSLVYGGGWVVNATAPLGGSVQYNISVQTFSTELDANPQFGAGVLPGESITLAWTLFSDVNGAPATQVTNVSIDGWYWALDSTDHESYINLFSGGIVQGEVSPTGQYTFTVPANASFDFRLSIAVWPTVVLNGVTVENESAQSNWGVGSLDVVVRQADEDSQVCPAYNDDEFASGTLVQVCVTVGADWGDGFYTVPNLPVSIHFWNGMSVVTPGGTPPSTLTSNSTGQVAFSYIVSTPPFVGSDIYPYYNAVNISVTDPDATSNTSDWSASDNASFYIYGGAAAGGVTVQLSQLDYYPGQTITASWAVSTTDESQTGPITAVSWYAYSNTYDGGYLAQGAISSTAATGTFTVPLPAGFIGEFYLDVDATNATTRFGAEAVSAVTAPVLVFNPSSTTYTPGSTVTITAEAYGDAALSGATITYQVGAYFGLGETEGGYGIVETGTVTNNSAFTIAVPSTGTPSEYEVYGYLGSPGSGTVATYYVELEQSWGYYVTVGVNTPSSYSDGSYQPGQTLTVAFQITPYGNAPLPVLYTFEVDLYGSQWYEFVSSPSTSGTFQLTIPSGQPSGIVFVEIYLQGTYLEGNTCYGGYCEGETALTINAHPSALSMEIGGNSGITVAWLILLIVILVVAVVLVLLIRRKPSPPGSSGGTSTTTPMSPPAPAPSGSGAQEWNEPAPSQPPMPTPPPGST